MDIAIDICFLADTILACGYDDLHCHCIVISTQIRTSWAQIDHLQLHGACPQRLAVCHLELT